MKLSARSAVRTVHDAVRTKLWPLPVLGVTVAVVIGIALPHVDALVDSALPGWINSILFSGDAGAARTVLNAVASSLITVTSLTFSLTVVTLQLASSQFSPRLLRTFTQDLFVQVTLAIFLSTFTYSLTVLRSVRSSQESANPFVPRIAVTTSFLLAIASVLCLVLFLAHLTRQIRVETMLRNVHHDASETLTANLAKREDMTRTDAVQPFAGAGSDEAAPLWSWDSGFLLRIDHDELCKAASEAGLTVHIERHVGDFVVAGTPLGNIWSTAGGSSKDSTRSEFEHAARAAIHFGPERTAAQDIGYGCVSSPM